MYLHVRNPSGTYLHSFAPDAHTLLIRFSLSLTVCVCVYFSSASRRRKLYLGTFALFSPPSVPGTSQETGQIWYQSPHLFWNLKVGAATRCKNNVVIEGEAAAATAIADSAGSTQRSQSAYCLGDICFTLYRLQMGLGTSGTVIKLHITTMTGVVFTYPRCKIISVYFWNKWWSWVSLLSADTSCTRSVWVWLYTCGILIMHEAECPIEPDWCRLFCGLHRCHRSGRVFISSIVNAECDWHFPEVSLQFNYWGNVRS